MLSQCRSTVRVLMPIRAASSRLCRPAASRFRTLKLAFGQVGHTPLGLTRRDQQPGRETGLEHAGPTGDGPHGLDQLLAGCGLAQVPSGPSVSYTHLTLPTNREV